eukprot:UN11682
MFESLGGNCMQLLLVRSNLGCGRHHGYGLTYFFPIHISFGNPCGLPHVFDIDPCMKLENYFQRFPLSHNCK